MIPNKFLLHEHGVKREFNVNEGNFVTIINDNKFIGNLYVSDNPDDLDTYNTIVDTTIKYNEDMLVGSTVWVYHLNSQQRGEQKIGYYTSETTLNDVTKEKVGLGNVPNLDTTDAVNNEHTHANSLILDATTASFTTVAENTLARLNDIKDNLTSNDTDKAGSANQLRILKGLIDDITTLLLSDDATLDELQEIVDFIKQNKDDLDTLSIGNIAGLSSALDDRELKLNKTTSVRTANSNDTLYPTEKAVRTELDLKSNSTHVHTADDVSETTTKKWMTQIERTSLSNKVDKVASTDEHIPIFDGSNGQLQDSLCSINGGNLHLGSGVYNKDGKLLIHPDAKYIRATYDTALHYGYTEYRNVDDIRGMYIGYGNGSTEVDVYLDVADVVNIKNGDLKIYNSDKGLVQPQYASDGKVYTSDDNGKGSWKYPMQLSQSIRGTRTRILEHFHSAATNDYIHIRTPLNIDFSAMFHFSVIGYAYGASAILDIVYVGYVYSTNNSLLNRQSLDRSGVFTEVDSYLGSDDHLYLRFKLPSDYYVSFSLESTVVGNGTIFDKTGFSVIRSDNATL